MSEEPPLTDQQQQETMQRIIHDAGLLVGGATIDTKGILRPTPEQVETLSHQGASSADNPPKWDSPTLTDRNMADRMQENSSERHSMDPERLTELLDGSVYAVLSNNIGQGVGQEETYYSFAGPDDHSPRVAAKLQDKWADFSTEMYEQLEGTGVSELVTIAKPMDFDISRGRRIHDIRQDKLDALSQVDKAHFDDEPVWVVNYIVITGGNYKYVEFPKEGTGRNTSLDCVALMRESDALELASAIQADPTLARQMADAMITNPKAQHVRAKDASNWARRRPPYEQWREQNGGFERLALRAAPSQSVEEAQIIEF